MDGSIEPYQNTTEGAEIFFKCNPGFVPTGRMRAVCGADGRWSPDPAGHRCAGEIMHTVLPVTVTVIYIFFTCHLHLFITPANCSDPAVPRNGSIDPYQNTTEGAEIFFRCNPGFVPAGRMRAVCGADGRWIPDPADQVCTGMVY